MALAGGGNFALDSQALVRRPLGPSQACGACVALRRPESPRGGGDAGNGAMMYRSALARTETRGMHRRLDCAGSDPTQRHAFASGGLDDVWVRALPQVERAEQELVA